MAFLMKGTDIIGNVLEPEVQTITYEYYLAHREEIEASNKVYMVEGEVDETLAANEVFYDNSTSDLKANSVQEAIDEVANRKVEDDMIFICQTPLFSAAPRTASGTGWTEISRTTLWSLFSSAIPEKAGYTKKIRIGLRIASNNSNTATVMFGGQQIFTNIDCGWSTSSVSNDRAIIWRTPQLYARSEFKDIPTMGEDASNWAGWYLLKIKSSNSYYLYVFSAWADMYYVKNT